MSEYIVKMFDGEHGRTHCYLVGGSIKCCGVRYAVVSCESHAKRFKSAKAAEAVYKKLLKSCCNMSGNYEIVEVGGDE